MKIKHKETGNSLGIDYLEWYNNYIKKGIYKKFEIVDYSGVVELQTLQKDGELKKQPFDKNSAMNNQRQFPNKMFIEKKLSFETYDKWLVIKSQSSFFCLFKKFRYQKPNIKFDIHSKRHMTIVVFMILTLFGMFYIAYKQGAFN
jgi:hypothetical protein